MTVTKRLSLAYRDERYRHYSGGMVGGDFCSIRKLSDTEGGILLCDVMGHGVWAALGTAIVRGGVVEDISHQKKDPGQFLGRLNQVLMPILASRRPVPVCHGVLHDFGRFNRNPTLCQCRTSCSDHTLRRPGRMVDG